MSRMKEIAEKYGEEYVLRQLAEECTELAQAALKLIRAKRKETPMRESEAQEHLIEEIADVTVMLQALYDTVVNDEMKDAICELHGSKTLRMYDRMLDGKMEEDVW